MSKAMLIMDMPECCNECPVYTDDGSQVCNAKDESVSGTDKYDDEADFKKPD